jgi:hypothetical protein
MPRASIAGITGQDGLYLGEPLAAPFEQLICDTVDADMRCERG